MTPLDPDLVDFEAWLEGDKRAGNRLFAKYYRQIYNFFDRKIGGDVSDLVQDTFETCTKNKGDFRRKSKFRTFLFGIAKYKMLEFFRKQRVATNTPVDFSVTSLADLGLSPTQLIHDRQQSRLVFEALRRIPIEQQLLLELKYWEKFTSPELSEIYEINVNTMSARLSRAKKALRMMIEHLEDDPAVQESTLSTLEDHIRALHEQARERFPGLSGGTPG